MELNLHPGAVDNFNNKSMSLLQKLSFKPEKQSKRTFTPDHFISATITESDIIGEVKFTMVDSVGNEIGIFFKYNGKQIGLYRENYQNLLKLAENMQKTNQLNQLISVCFLKDSIFDWLRDKHTGKTSNSMVDYVLDKCEKEIKELEIWIPIAETCIQSKFDIGKITLVPITKDILNQLVDQWVKKDEFLNMYQKELQGIAAAKIRLLAEPQRAAEIAVKDAEKSISILRVFHPANINPQLVSYWTLLGKENKERMSYYVVQEHKLVSMTEKLLDNSVNWVLDTNSILWMKQRGLDILSDLLRLDDKALTQFQRQVLDSLYLYSRNSLAKDVADKLVYILVALESLLLKDRNEPIQQNISDRMALFIGRNPDEMENIVKTVKDVYDLRSAFIHHGHSVENIECLRLFMKYTWTFFRLVIQNVNNYDNKVKFINSIDKKKYYYSSSN